MTALSILSQAQHHFDALGNKLDLLPNEGAQTPMSWLQIKRDGKSLTQSFSKDNKEWVPLQVHDFVLSAALGSSIVAGGSTGSGKYEMSWLGLAVDLNADLGDAEQSFIKQETLEFEVKDLTKTKDKLEIQRKTIYKQARLISLCKVHETLTRAFKMFLVWVQAVEVTEYEILSDGTLGGIRSSLKYNAATGPTSKL